jgi:Fic-DOC domain mobile mystery protein B
MVETWTMNAINNLNAASGNTPIDPDERSQLIPNLATKRELDEWERKNIIEGREWALSQRTIRKRDPFDEAYLREIHKRMFDQTWKWAGTYRNSEKTIGCLVHEIRERISALRGDGRFWAENKTFPGDEIGVRFHHRLVGAIHPFPNGNGRHARLHADVIAIRLGGTEFSWGQNELAGTGPIRGAYIHSLQAADMGDIQPLLQFARS